MPGELLLEHRHQKHQQYRGEESAAADHPCRLPPPGKRGIVGNGNFHEQRKAGYSAQNGKTRFDILLSLVMKRAVGQACMGGSERGGMLELSPSCAGISWVTGQQNAV